MVSTEQMEQRIKKAKEANDRLSKVLKERGISEYVGEVLPDYGDDECEEPGVCIDGGFSVSDLRAIADAIEGVKVEV